MPEDIVSLDVGGTIFKTTRTTLNNYPDSMVTKMVAKAEMESLTQPLFIDCSPATFHYILNYFRRGDTTALPENRDLLKEIRVEADYYSLPSMVDLIDNKLKSLELRDPLNGYVLKIDFPAFGDKEYDHLRSDHSEYHDKIFKGECIVSSKRLS